MIRQIFTIAIRNILKDKIFSSLNFANLAVGFATLILLCLYFKHLLDWDKHHEHYDRIYRLQLFMDQKENVTKHTWSSPAAISRQDLPQLPEVEKVALLHDVGDNNKDGVFLSANKQTQWLIRYGYFSDQSIFEIFSFEFLEGEKSTALTNPMSIVLSKSLAEKLFPGGNAIGKSVHGENKVTFTVTGVYNNFPESSSWAPAYLLPMISYTELANSAQYEKDYWSYGYHTYVLLKENVDPESVSGKLFHLLNDYRKEHHPYLRPLAKLYLNPYFQNDMYLVQALLSLNGLLILFLATFNFINLQTANATTRLKEIGVKKTVGFTKKQLWIQFICESVLFSVVACTFGIIMADMFLPVFSSIIGQHIAENVYNQPVILLGILFVSILIGVLSGLYPAYIIASYDPVKALRKRFLNDRTTDFSFKKVLVTAQYSISLFLIIVSLIIFKQSKYLVTRDLGFDPENLVYANIVTDDHGSFDSIRNRLLNYPEIIDVCRSDYIPYILPGGDDLTWEGADSLEKVFVRISNISYNFLETYKIAMLQGRNFHRNYHSDTDDKCLINETAAKVFRWEKPLGKCIPYRGKNKEVIGIVKDYFPFSVHNQIEPHLYLLLPDSADLDGLYTVRFKPKKELEAKTIISKEIAKALPNDVFKFRDYKSLIYKENAYIAWKSFSKLSIFFASISIVVSTVGLFGLIIFYTRRKMKEIGIKKLHGFSLSRIYLSLSSEFLILIFFSNFIAWPTALGMYYYLPGSYKYPISIWEFIIGSTVIFCVTFLTIGYHIYKAAKTNPVEILKYE